jgi:hypothetical protein
MTLCFESHDTMLINQESNTSYHQIVSYDINHVVGLRRAGELHCPSYLMLGWRQRRFVLLLFSSPHISVLFVSRIEW